MDTSSDNPWRVSWEALTARAWAALNRYGPIPPAVQRGRAFYHYPRVRLTDDPGGYGPESDPKTLTVFELYTDAEERQTVVRESVWNRDADGDRVRAATDGGEPAFVRPTVAERYAEVPRAWLSVFLRDGCAFRVPVAWPGSWSVTSGPEWSESYEFFTRDQPAAVLRLKWFYPPPGVWQPVGEWYARLSKFLTRCLDGDAPTGRPPGT